MRRDANISNKMRPGWEEADYFRPAWCAARVHKSPAWAFGKIAAGELLAVRLFGSLRIRRADWEAFVAANIGPAEKTSGTRHDSA